MYTQWEKIDFERALRTFKESEDLDIPAYVFDSAIKWLMDNYNSINKKDGNAFISALWNGYINTETPITGDIKQYFRVSL